MAKKKKGKKAIALPSPVDMAGAFGRVVNHKAAAALGARGWWVRYHLDDGRVYVQGDRDVQKEEARSEEGDNGEEVAGTEEAAGPEEAVDVPA